MGPKHVRASVATHKQWRPRPNGHTGAASRWLVRLVVGLTLPQQANCDVWSPRPDVFHVPVGPDKKQETLFDPSGPVRIFTGQELDKELMQSPQVVWVVDYYNVACPHCWYFAPVLTQLAEAYKADGEHKFVKVRFGSYNCAEYENYYACLRAGGSEYPHVVAYHLPPQVGYPTAVPHQAEGTPLSAHAIAEWLQQRSPLFAPLRPLPRGADFQGHGTSETVVVSGPPGPPGWLVENVPGTHRINDARSGLVALLMDGYDSTSKQEPARKAVEFLMRAFPQGNSYFQQLGWMINQDEVEPRAMQSVLQRWWRFFPRPHFTVCKDETPCRTCAIWQLFHIVAASVAGTAIGHGRLMLQMDLQQTTVGNATVEEAMGFVVDVVTNFLSCTACRHHFLTAFHACHYGSCEVLRGKDEPERAKSMVLWLWRVHNAVSIRVLSHHPPSAQQGRVDRRWPPYRDCPGCWKQDVVLGHKAKAAVEPDDDDSNETDANATDDNETEEEEEVDIDAAFETDKVFAFLLQTYLGDENIKPLKSKILQSKLLSAAPESKQGATDSKSKPRPADSQSKPGSTASRSTVGPAGSAVQEVEVQPRLEQFLQSVSFGSSSPFALWASALFLALATLGCGLHLCGRARRTWTRHAFSMDGGHVLLCTDECAVE